MQQGMGLVVSLILARLLGPSAYGLIGMVAIFTGFGSMFVDLGLASGLVQRKDLEAEHTSSVFWANILMGSILTISMISVAPLVARFYSEPALILIARVSSVAFVLGALGTVQNALLSRDMRFGALAKIDMISTALSGLLGISMALNGNGVWSLVAQSLSATFVRTLGLWGISQWRPKLLFTVKALREFAGFSGNLLGFNAFNYWVRNADNLLIGRFIGSQALGLYSRAYQLMVLPVYQISAVAGAVMFPVLSSVQHDLARVRSIYLRSIGSIHLVTAPIYVGLFVIADTFVGAVLGERWRGLVPVLRILCTCGFFQPVGNSTGWLYTSLGRTDKMFKWGVLTGVMYVVGFFIGLKWGLLGVTWSYCLVSWVFWYPCWSIPGRLVGLSFAQMLAPLMPSSLCAIAMGIVTWIVGLYLKPVEPTWIVLLTQVASGTAIYCWLVLGLRVKSGKEVLDLIAEQLRFAKA